MEAGGTTRHCTEVNRQPSPCGIASARRRPWRHHRWGTDRDFPHSTRFSGKGYHRSSKASRREDVQVEEPVACGDCSSFHFHATLAGMLRAPLVGHEVVQMGQPSQKRLLAPFGMMEPFIMNSFRSMALCA